MIRRREFITLLGGAAAWPLEALAQQQTTPVVGYLDLGSPEPSAHLLAAFRKGLSETGYIEGHNLAIQYRWARDNPDQLPELAADLVGHRVAVIATGDSTAAALAAKAATTTIPIVFSTGIDPVESGLVHSLERPGGNVTGITHVNAELAEKRLGLLHDLVPSAARIAVLSPAGPFANRLSARLTVAAAVNGQKIELLPVSTSHDVETSFADLLQKRTDALLVGPGLSPELRAQILTLASHHSLPTIYPWRDDAVAGGLMSYGIVITDQFRLIGIYTGRILMGDKPADLPVMRPTKFEFVINLKTVRTQGLSVPPGLLAIADEVIE